MQLKKRLLREGYRILLAQAHRGLQNVETSIELLETHVDWGMPLGYKNHARPGLASESDTGSLVQHANTGLAEDLATFRPHRSLLLRRN